LPKAGKVVFLGSGIEERGGDLVAFPLTKFEKRAILVRKRVNSVGWGAPGFRRPSAIFPEVSQRLHCPNHSIFPA